MLQRFPRLREMLDPDLFLHRELDDTYLPSSKLKWCSDFIALGEFNDNMYSYMIVTLIIIICE